MERPKASLGPAGDGSGHLHLGGGGCPPGQDEKGVILNQGREPIHFPLASMNNVGREMIGILFFPYRGGCGHEAHGDHQFALDGVQEGLALVLRFERGANQADLAIQLVEATVGLDADIVFRDSCSPVDAGRASVAGFRINSFHDFQSFKRSCSPQ